MTLLNVNFLYKVVSKKALSEFISIVSKIDTLDIISIVSFLDPTE